MADIKATREEKYKRDFDYLENKLEKYPLALNPEEVAAVLGVTRRYVDKLIDDNILEHFVIDPNKQYKQKRVLKSKLIDYMIQQYKYTN